MINRSLNHRTYQPIATSPTPSVSLKDWIAVLGTLLGAFMAVLDIQITNASLKDIEGALTLSLDEGSWISTSYLVAEIVVIPLTAWLSQVFSVRLYLFVNAGLFILFSMCCAWSWDLNSIILFRGLQGFTGGVLIPMAFTIILTNLPLDKQPIGMSLFGVTATFAPAIGPMVGGWLNDNYGWQSIFYLNVFPGVLLMAAVWWAVAAKPLQLHLLKYGDWWGIVTMAIGLASLEVVLEEGNRKDWFSSELITRLAILAVIFLALFFWNEFTRKQPFINLRLMVRRNFGLSSIVNTGLGIGLYGASYILTLYLGQIQRYNAMQIGETIAWAGLPQLLVMPWVPTFMKRVDARILIGGGMSLFAVSCFMNSTLTQDVGIDQLRISQIVRALGLPFVLVPLSSVATANIEPSQVGSASSLFNMMRNLGGSIGIASLSTVLTRREQFHSNRIGEAVSMYNPETQQRITQLQQFFISQGADPGTAQTQAIGEIDAIVRNQANIMGYNDCFHVLGWAILLSALAVLLLKRVKLSGTTAAH